MPARQHLLAVEVAAIGHRFELLNMQRSFRGLGGVGEMRRIVAHIRHLVRDDQMMLGVHRRLYVVADQARTAPTRRHGAAVGIGQRDLLIGRGQHLLLDGCELGHLRFQLLEFFFQVRLFQRDRLGRLLKVGGIGCDR